MRLGRLAKGVFAGGSLFLAVTALANPQKPAVSHRLVTRQQGLEIVDAASEHQQTISTKPDCSHLVYEVYRLAGYPYPYASSSDLYRGSENFVRVRKPQSGDLVVWRGHVGLVVDPREHSFYSSLRSGLETDDYTSPYWRRYGVPRFYRYRMDNREILTARAVGSGRQIEEASVDAEAVSAREPIREPVNDPEPSAARKFSRAPATEVSHSTSSATSSRVLSASAPRPVVPGSMPIAAEKYKPTADEVAEAISRWNQASSNALSSDDILQPQFVVVIYDQIRVDRVQCKGNRGWAYLQVSAQASLDSSGLSQTVQQEKQHWELRRSTAGWSLVKPQDRLYVSREVAVRILAESLASLAATEKHSAESDAMLGEESRLASLLNELLKNRK